MRQAGQEGSQELSSGCHGRIRPWNPFLSGRLLQHCWRGRRPCGFLKISCRRYRVSHATRSVEYRDGSLKWSGCGTMGADAGVKHPRSSERLARKTLVKPGCRGWARGQFRQTVHDPARSHRSSAHRKRNQCLSDIRPPARELASRVVAVGDDGQRARSIFVRGDPWIRQGC
jgi:hypothetical protein